MRSVDGTKRPVQSYRDLDVWVRAIDLSKKIYRLTRAFPREEIFGLTSQIRRAAVSVPANIAEGSGRRGTKEFLYHAGVARGSLYELVSLIDIALDQAYLTAEDAAILNDEAGHVGRLISGLIRSLERSQTAP